MSAHKPKKKTRGQPRWTKRKKHAKVVDPNKIADAKEPREFEAEELERAAEEEQATESESGTEDDESGVADPGNSSTRYSPVLTEPSETPLQHTSNEKFLVELKKAYSKDTLFSKVIADVEHFKGCSIQDDILYTKNRAQKDVMCVPRPVKGKRTLTTKILEEAHASIGHLGAQRASEYVRAFFWWPSLGRDADAFCRTCTVFQATKASTKKPYTPCRYPIAHGAPSPWTLSVHSQSRSTATTTCG